MTNQYIGLADANNFFVSCERVLDSSLNGKPVVVLSSNDGCVVARSNEAKDLGVQMGEAIFKRRSWFRYNKVIMLSANFSLYSDLSRRTFDILQDMTPAIECYSIDEAFFTPAPSSLKSYKAWADSIHKRVLTSVGIPLSLGVAKTKTLAKLAVRTAKKSTSNCHMLITKQDVFLALTKTSVNDIWGIGKQLALYYRSQNINTAYDLTQASAFLVRKRLGITGLRTYYELQEQPCYHLITKQNKPIKSCLVSRSFGQSITDITNLKNAITNFTNSLCRKLRKGEVLAENISVFLNTNRFKENFFAPEASIDIPPSNDTAIINKYTNSLLNSIYKPNHKYCRAGVMTTSLIPCKPYNLSLFADSQLQREKLWQAVDAINSRYGLTTLRCGHIQTNPNWVPRRNHGPGIYSQSASLYLPKVST